MPEDAAIGLQYTAEEFPVATLGCSIGHDSRIQFAGHFLSLGPEGIRHQRIHKAGRLNCGAIGPAASECLEESLRKGGQPGILHALDFPVRFAAAFHLEAEIKDIGEAKTLFEDRHIAVRCLRKFSGTDQHSAANGTTILHHKSAQFAGVFNSVKSKGSVLGRG